MPHPRPAWLRRLRRVCLLLALGLGTTVGVAWGLAFAVDLATWPGRTVHHPDLAELRVRGAWESPAGPHARSTTEAFGAIRRYWFNLETVNSVVYATPDATGTPIIHAWSVTGPERWGRIAAASSGSDEHAQPSSGLEDARGWPALSLWCELTNFEQLRHRQAAEALFAGGIALPSNNADPVYFSRALPLFPIWPGLVFDTLFYALLWWLAFASVRMITHNRRYRRGLCPMCRYDLRANFSQGCSECGWKRA